MKQLTYLLFAAMLLTLTRCANQSNPQGGPRDTQPPQLLSSIPPHEQTNFHGKIVVFEFDEMLKLNNPQEEIIITPRVSKKVNYRLRNNKLFIEPEKNWRDSLTYTISLRKAVQDITEGNTAEDIQLAFSTGNEIDTMAITGHVRHLFTNKPADKITIGIYATDTFDVFKHTPDYFTKSNDKGYFALKNLKPGIYYLYAFDDKNKNLKAETPAEKFGFQPTSINLLDSNQNTSLHILNLDYRPLAVTSIRANGNLNKVRFKKNIVQYTLQSARKYTHTFGDDPSQIDIYLPTDQVDSTLVSLHVQDSIGLTLDSTFYVKTTQAKRGKDKFTTSATITAIDLKTQSLELKLSANLPIGNINPDSAYIQIDSTRRIPFSASEFSLDTVRKTIHIKKSLAPFNKDSINWSKTIVHLAKGLITSHVQDSSKQTLIPLKPEPAENLAAIDLKLITKIPHYVLQLITRDGKVIRSLPDFKSGLIPDLQPNTYQLRLLVDRNHNQSWDTGNYYERTTPETFLYYTNSENQTDIPLRANWEVEITFTTTEPVDNLR